MPRDLQELAEVHGDGVFVNSDFNAHTIVSQRKRERDNDDVEGEAAGVSAAAKQARKMTLEPFTAYVCTPTPPAPPTAQAAPPAVDPPPHPAATALPPHCPAAPQQPAGGGVSLDMVKQLLSEQAAESDRKLQKQAAESDRKLQKLEKQAAKHRELAAETNARLSALELTVAEQVRENGELVAQDRPVLRVAHCIPSQSLNRV